MQYYLSYLDKAENPAAYKRLAERGLMVGRKVSIAGQEHRPDIGIPYHSTLKFFNPDKDTPEQVHQVANKLQHTPPDTKNMPIEPGMFKDRFGNDVYVIKFSGLHAEEMKSHHKQFAHLGYPANFEYTPHISVDKQTHDKVKASGAKTAHEAGINFGPVQLLQGHKVLHTYEPKQEKLAASEKETQELMFKNEISLSSVREAIARDLVLNKKHLKAYRLPDDYLSRYIYDNPDLKKSAEEVHKKRIAWHFSDNKELTKIAWEQGIVQAYLHKTSKK